MDDRWRALRARMAFKEASSFADVTFFLDLLVFFTLLFFDIVFVQFIGRSSATPPELMVELPGAQNILRTRSYRAISDRK